jgi:hypothetical protein
VPLQGQINRAIVIPLQTLPILLALSVGEQVPTFGAHRSCYEKQPAMPPKRASSKAAPSIDEAAKAALLAEKKGKALADNTPPKGLRRRSCQQKTVSRPSHPQRHPMHLQLRRRTASTTTRLHSTRGRRRNRGRRSHRHLSRRPATAVGPAYQEPQPPKAERHPRGQAPTCHRAGQGAPDDTRRGAESSRARARNRAHAG